MAVEAPEAGATSQRSSRSCAEVFELGWGSVDCHCEVVKWEQDREERRETGADGGEEGSGSILRGVTVSSRNGKGCDRSSSAGPLKTGKLCNIGERVSFPATGIHLHCGVAVYSVGTGTSVDGHRGGVCAGTIETGTQRKRCETGIIKEALHIS